MNNYNEAFFKGFFKRAAEHNLNNQEATAFYYKYAEGDPRLVGAPGSVDEWAQNLLGAKTQAPPALAQIPTQAGTQGSVPVPQSIKKAPPVVGSAPGGTTMSPGRAAAADANTFKGVPSSMEGAINNLKRGLGMSAPANTQKDAVSAAGVPIGANIRR